MDKWRVVEFEKDGKLFYRVEHITASDQQPCSIKSSDKAIIEQIVKFLNDGSEKYGVVKVAYEPIEKLKKFEESIDEECAPASTENR